MEFTDTLLRITVTDFGIGIPQADHPKLFGPFVRASNVENINGTGLGLAIAKHISDLHGGTISFSSNLKAGTVFTVELPFQRTGNRK